MVFLIKIFRLLNFLLDITENILGIWHSIEIESFSNV